MITQERLKELLVYDKNTGLFIWNVNTRRIKKGCIAGTKHSAEYTSIQIDGKHYLSHRLAWLYVYGELPENELDHINHDRTDHRISNLRIVTHRENGLNQSLNSKNTSGKSGVYFHSKNNRWIAQIYIHGKKLHIGSFSNKKDAIEARNDAEIKHGYHENHGAT